MTEQSKSAYESYDVTMRRIKRLQQTWRNMKYRCYGKHNSARTEKCYQGKGISVCDEWLNNFGAFYDWSISHGYQDGLTIDRIDPKGDYSPSNCQWITMSENAARRTVSIAHEFDMPPVYVNVVALCEKHNITIARLESETGLGNATVRGWVKSVPNLGTLKKVADYFNVTIDDLLSKQWTGELIGDIHNAGFKIKDVAAAAGLNPKYVSQILHGKNQSSKAESRLREALSRLIQEKDTE